MALLVLVAMGKVAPVEVAMGQEPVALTAGASGKRPQVAAGQRQTRESHCRDGAAVPLMRCCQDALQRCRGLALQHNPDCPDPHVHRRPQVA